MADEGTFLIDFRLVREPSGNEIGCLDSEDELNDLESVLQIICRKLEGRTKFVVNAFDVTDWPVDVRADFSVFLEQAPKMLEFLISDTKRSFVLDFYEQGIERELTFTYEGDTVVITCKSRIAWRPNREKILLSRRKLGRLLIDVFANFEDVVNKFCPDAAQNVMFRDWLESIKTNIAQITRKFGLR